MATTSETTYTYMCDLCGKVREQDQLRQLYDSATHHIAFRNDPKKVDICVECTTKPIGEVFAFWQGAESQLSDDKQDALARLARLEASAAASR